MISVQITIVENILNIFFISRFRPRFSIPPFFVFQVLLEESIGFIVLASNRLQKGWNHKLFWLIHKPQITKTRDLNQALAVYTASKLFAKYPSEVGLQKFTRNVISYISHVLA